MLSSSPSNNPSFLMQATWTLSQHRWGQSSRYFHPHQEGLLAWSYWQQQQQHQPPRMGRLESSYYGSETPVAGSQENSQLEIC